MKCMNTMPTHLSPAFQDYANMWLQVYKAPPRIRESSFATLKSTLDKNVIPFFGNTPMGDITNMHVQLYINSIAHLSRGVQRKCLQYLRAIFDTAVDNGLLERTPVRSTDKTSGEQPKEQEALTNEQARALLDAVRGTRAYLFCLIALSTGLRRGEILGLMWEDIDFEHSVINVTHNKAFSNNANDAEVTTMLKTEAARRRVPIAGVLYDELMREREYSDSDFVIHMENGKSLTKGSFRSLWDIVDARTVSPGHPLGSRVRGAQVGAPVVSLDFPCHPHQLRHTFCTQCVESGMEIKTVQYLMGHATPEVTLRVYAHYRLASQQAHTLEQIQTMTSYLG